jgi:hypothetical protein
VIWALAPDPPIPPADPIDDQAAVLVRCLLPREVTGVERTELAVREEVVEVLVVRPGTRSSSRPATIWAGMAIVGSRSRDTGFCWG